MDAAPTPHTGRPILRPDKRGMLVLCPLGHVVTFQPAKEWAGSWLEAKASDPAWTVSCNGTLPEAP